MIYVYNIPPYIMQSIVKAYIDFLIESSNLNALVNNAVNLYDRGIQGRRVTWVREMTRHQAEKAGQVTVNRICTLCYRADAEPIGVEWLEPFQE